MAALKEAVSARRHDSQDPGFNEARFFRGLQLTRGENSGVRLPVHHAFHHVREFIRPVIHAVEEGLGIVARVFQKSSKREPPAERIGE